jgi:toxin CptA
MLALFFVSIHQVVLVLLLLVLMWSMVYFMRRDAILVLPTAWCALRLEEDGGVVLIDRSGKEVDGELSHGCVVMPYLLILNVMVETTHRRCCVVLMPDSMDTESFRQLRVALKWGVTSA